MKLYNQTLSELRFIHNEITNIEMKSSGLQTAIASSDDKSISDAVKNAINTERNFILEKGKTTVDLERSRQENESSFVILSTLRELLVPRIEAAAPKSGKKTKHS